MKRSVGATVVAVVTTASLAGGADEAMAQSSPSTATTQSTILTVSSKADWVRVPISLKPGQEYVLHASGHWTVDYRNFPEVGPSGYDEVTDAKIYQGCKIAHHPYAMLLGKFRNDPAFPAGSGGNFNDQGRGALFLRINDATRCMGDNAGAITVHVTSRSSTPDSTSRPLITWDEMRRALECGASVSVHKTIKDEDVRLALKAVRAARDVEQAKDNLWEVWVSIGLAGLPFSGCVDPLFRPPEVS